MVGVFKYYCRAVLVNHRVLSIDIPVFYPELRGQLLRYLQGYFNMNYRSLNHLIRAGISDSLGFLMKLKLPINRQKASLLTDHES